MNHTPQSIAASVALGCVFGLFPVWAMVRFGAQEFRVPEVFADATSSFSGISSVKLPWQARGFDTVVQTPPRILFVGDIMLDRNVAKHMKSANDLAYPFRKLPDGWFNTFDYAVANLEGPVTDKLRAPVKSIDFRFDPAVLPMLKETGIDAFSQANNHTLDQGSIGAADSRKRLQDAGFLVFGDQVHDDAISLATTTVNGVKIAFLGFNTTDNPLDEADASAILKKVRMEADRVIVYMHWGTEYKNHPDAAVIARAHWLIDHGADAVIGGHPHWVQGMEWYKGYPIIYSLGNFVFDQYFSKETQEGMAVVLTMDSVIIDAELIPIKNVASQAIVVEGEERIERLKAFTNTTNELFRSSVEAGLVPFPF